MQAMLRAGPDGHTMLMGSIGPNAAADAVFQKLRYAPADLCASIGDVGRVIGLSPEQPCVTIRVEWTNQGRKPAEDVVIGPSRFNPLQDLGNDSTESEQGEWMEQLAVDVINSLSIAK